MFNPSEAQAALIASLDSANEELQLAAIHVLALLRGGLAQRAIAQLALDSDEVETLRIDAFAGLTTSAKRFGNQLDAGQVDELLSVSMDEPDLRLRTAASHALGALNLAADKANQTILRFHRG